MQSTLEAALDYASKGIPIFPITPNGKQPAISKAEGGHGFADASTDPRLITEWFERFPLRNIALCPDDIGCYVVDFDGDAGRQSASIIEFTYGLESAPRIVVSTPSGGRHHYYKGRMHSSVKKVMAGVDIRGIGGYVLIPPSVINGVYYTFMRGQIV